MWPSTLPHDVNHYICNQFLDGPSYIRWIHTCKTFMNEMKPNRFIRWNGLTRTYRLLTLVLDEERNVLMHGSAGCGKSFSLKRLYVEANKQRKKIVMTSMTGVSSLLLPEGKTLHSFSGLGTAKVPIEDLKRRRCIQNESYRNRKFYQWLDAEILVIDEVSMLGSKFFEKLNWLAKTVRRDPRPFGGLIVVFCGDFMQLPPVRDRFVYKSEFWSEMNLIPIFFDVPFRQSHDLEYFKFLERLRDGKHTEEDYRLLRKQIKPYDIEKEFKAIAKDNHILCRIISPQLFSTRNQVARVNQTFFRCVPTEVEHSVGSVDRFERMEKCGDDDNDGTVIFHRTAAIPIPPSKANHINHTLPDRVYLKPGVQYFLTSNLRPYQGLVNGSLCVYMGGNVFCFENGEIADAQTLFVTRSFFIANNTYLKRTQLALRVGYAATIHSSQGMSMTRAIVDLGPDVFSYQAYVALSRVTCLDGLHLLDLHPKSLRVNASSIKYIRELKGVPSDYPLVIE